MKNKKLGLFLVLFSGMVLGSMPGLISFCKTQGANNTLMLLFRFAILALIVLPLALRDGNLLSAFRKNWKTLLLLSVSEGLTPLFLYMSYEHMASGLSMTIHFLYPTFIVAACVLFYREKLSLHKLMCLLLSLAGIALTVDLKSNSITLVGLAFTMASTVTYSAYIIWMDKAKLRDITSIQVAFFVGVGCFCVALIYGLLSGTLDAVTRVTPLGWLSLTGAGTLIAAGGSLCFILGVRNTDAQVAAICSTLEPLTSIVIGIAFLGEALTVRIAIGCLLILSAVVLLPIFTMREERAKQ